MISWFLACLLAVIKYIQQRCLARGARTDLARALPFSTISRQMVVIMINRRTSDSLRCWDYSLVPTILSRSEGLTFSSIMDTGENIKEGVCIRLYRYIE